MDIAQVIKTGPAIHSEPTPLVYSLTAHFSHSGNSGGGFAGGSGRYEGFGNPNFASHNMPHSQSNNELVDQAMQSLTLVRFGV